MPWDELAEMHLLLREAGWEPEQPEPWLGISSQFWWQHAAYQMNYWHQDAEYQNHTAFLTDREGWREAEVVGSKEYGYSAARGGSANPSVDELRRRLKELAR